MREDDHMVVSHYIIIHFITISIYSIIFVFAIQLFLMHCTNDKFKRDTLEILSRQTIHSRFLFHTLSKSIVKQSTNSATNSLFKCKSKKKKNNQTMINWRTEPAMSNNRTRPCEQPPVVGSCRFFKMLLSRTSV